MTELGDLLRGAREAAGLTLKQAGKASGIHYSSLSKIEQDGHIPSRTDPAKLTALAEVLDVDPQRVLELAGVKPRSDLRRSRPSLEEFILTEPTLTGNQRAALIGVVRELQRSAQ